MSPSKQFKLHTHSFWIKEVHTLLNCTMTVLTLVVLEGRKINIAEYVPYARHYNPRFVFFLPHFSLRFIFESGLYCREVSIYMILFSSKFATKNRKSKYYLVSTAW